MAKKGCAVDAPPDAYTYPDVSSCGRFHAAEIPHQQKRINVVLGLESDPYGVEYNVNQSKIAIGHPIMCKYTH